MKKFLADRLSSSTALISGLLALLMLLASLQYSWLGEISAGERDRMQALVNSGAARFGEDFDLEIAGMFLGLQMHADTVRAQDWERYQQRYEHWRARSTHPRLVGDIYLAQLYENGRVRLLQFNPDKRQFVTTEWIAAMSGLRRRFEQSLKTMHVEGGLLVGNTPDPVADDIPALVIPVAHMELLSDPQNTDIDTDLIFGETVLRRRLCPRCRSNDGLLFAYTIVTLNQQYLWQQFVPELARKYFATGDRLDYNVAIVSRRDPSRLVYHTNSAVYETAPVSGDATSYLFSLRLDEINRLLLDDTLRLGDLPDIGDRQSWRIAVGRTPSQEPESGAALAGSASGRWQLILTHRAGSLEAAVAGLRFRNLLISSGILLLLAVSVVTMLVTSRRAQRLADQKMEFVAAISHELRTPLAVICSAGENLADGVVPDPQRARQYGAVIHTEGRRLAEMVDQALEFAGAESGRKAYAPRPIAVRELLDQALTMCQPQLHERGFVVDQQIPADLPLVLVDPTEMVRALQNLIRNAIKYGGEDRWIGLHAQAQAGERGREVYISVRDAGMGIAPEDLPHIFEPFYRSHDAIAAQIHGSGLGLSMVRQIVEAHGGRIVVQSTLGRGSAFTIYLPCATGNERQPALGRRAATGLRGKLGG
ncbi:MAG: HAMP domain-containing histidine kinase [Kouleothrix sp.]|nr:HAMP domain-containing histidine kinase [Kouleothrix sp.]